MDNTTKLASKASPPLPSASNLAEAIKARRSGHGFLSCCPEHGDRTPSLFFKDGEKAILFKCFAGCSSEAVVEAFRNLGYWSGESTWQAPTLKQEDEAEARPKQQQKAQALWHTAGEIKPGDPVHTYLKETRQLNLSTIPADLRIAPSLEYWTTDGDKPRLVARTPAMLGAVRSLSGELLAVHRTYLSPDGKKLNPEAYGLPRHAPIKKVLGSIANGAIHLYEFGETLLIAEGIETALAASLLSGLPAWSAISATNMERLDVPSGVKTVIICVDNDEAGERSSRRFAARLMRSGKSVKFSYPARAGAPAKGDWADLVGGAA